MIIKQSTKNKKGFGWLTFILLLALLAVAAVVIFREFLPRVVSIASQQGYIESEKPPTQYTLASLETHKGIVDQFMHGAGADTEIEITFSGEIHRKGFSGETCYVCRDYDFRVVQKISLADFTAGLKTHRVTARDIAENPDDANLDGIDTMRVEKIDIIYKGIPAVNGYAEEQEAAGAWAITSFVPDEKGGLKYDAKTKQILAVQLGTVSDIRFFGREIQYQLNPAYTAPQKDAPQEEIEPETEQAEVTS